MFQISFRVVNCLLYKKFDVAGNSPLCLMVLVAWALTEIIRYPYYLSSLLNVKPGLLTWLRYNMFIILYPMGGVGETCLTTLVLWHHPPLNGTNIFRGFASAPVGEALSHYLPIVAYFMAFAPLGISLYQHMFAQRRKILSKPPKKDH